MSDTQSVEQIVAFGHNNVLATHPTTLMITKDVVLSPQGDCVIAVGADKAVADLSEKFKSKLRKPNSKLTVIIEAGGHFERVNARGSTKLSLTHQADVVVRKSDFSSDRTLGVCADKSASELSRKFVEKLKTAGQKVIVTLILT